MAAENPLVWAKQGSKLSEADKANIKAIFAPTAEPAWLKPTAKEEAEDAKKFMTVTMKKNMLNAEPQNAFHRVLLLGDSGTGKTHFIGTMPKPFVADFDRGLSTLRGKDVTVAEYGPEDWPKFKAEVMIWRGGPEDDRQTFALDSLTMASEAAMTYVLAKNNRKDPTVQDWGQAIREVKDLLGYITTLPCHVVVTAHNQLVKDETLGDIQFLPLIYGKDLPHRLGIWFDEVYSTTVAATIVGGKKDISYRLQVKPDDRNKIIKSRMNTDGKLFEMYETPDFSALVAKSTKEK